MKNTTHLKNYLKNYLQAFATKTPVTAAELGTVAHLPKRDGNWHRLVRKAIEELVTEGCPIGGDQGGYMWITSDPSLQHHLNVLQKRQVALSKRIASLYEAYNLSKKA